MIEANHYTINTMEDVLALTPEQRERMVVDMLEWCKMCDSIKELPYLKGFLEVEPKFTWVDDDRIGEVSGVNITIEKMENN